MAALGLLLPYHVGMLYVRWDFHLKSSHAGPAPEPFMLLSSPWRLSLLFMVSGVVTAQALARASPEGFVRRRARRLLLPLLVGVVLLIPPQSYIEVIHKWGYPGSYVDFLGLYFTGYDGFCKAGHCLILPTWNHLWFLPYLWLYTVVLVLLMRERPGLLAACARRLAPGLQGGGLLWLPVLWLALLRWGLAGRFPETHALVDDWFAHCQYLGLFLTGATLALRPGAWPVLADWRWQALAMAVLGWLGLLDPAGVMPPALRPLCAAAEQWGAVVAAFGFAYRHWNHDHPWRKALSQAVFPVYIFHQTFLIILAYGLFPLGWPPLLEALALVLGTLVLSGLAYALVRHLPVARQGFGLP